MRQKRETAQSLGAPHASHASWAHGHAIVTQWCHDADTFLRRGLSPLDACCAADILMLIHTTLQKDDEQ